jgi:hypothetical protein
MSKLALLVPGLFALAACSDSSSEPGSRSGAALLPVALPEATAHPAWVVFLDPENGLSTQDVRDADREIVHFDQQSQALIWAASGDPIGGWVTEGNDLRWERTGGSFRVRFGSEAGEHRAYFTETGPGTICNLSLTAPGQLSISATSQTPPGS